MIGEGDESDWVGVILEGKARALRYSPGGEEVIVSTFGPGSLFGEMVALQGGLRTADIYALEELKLACIPGPAFVGLLKKHAVLGIELCRLLAARIERTTHKLFDEVTLTSKHKVFAWLVHEAEETGTNSEPMIETMPTVSDLARNLNLARETVSRTLSSLKDQGIVLPKGRGLVLQDRHALIRLLEQ